MGTESSPKISIITVVLNDLAGLIRSAKSVDGQNSSDFEWVVLDGKSLDGSAEFVRNLNLGVKTTAISSEPKGIYNAMNLAATYAQGEWLWFINAGDFLLGPDAVSTIIEKLNHSSVEIIATPVIHVTSSGYVHDLSYPNIVTNTEGSEANFNHQGVLISRAAFIKLKGYDENLKFASDGKLLDEAINSFTHEILPDLLVGFVMGGQSGRNYSEVLREISTYRHNAPKLRKSIVLRIKNYIRHFILDFSTYSKFVQHSYFSRRERRILERIKSKCLQVKHWETHNSTNERTLGCCLDVSIPD
jgi:glycosyltransferase involved in cell wall biosynthesis